MTTQLDTSPTDALVGRIFVAGIGTAELANVYLGIHLGLYRALVDAPATPPELAARTGCDPRYIREWLQGQAVSGFMVADGSDPATARFALAEGAAAVFVEETAPSYLGGMADILAAVGRVLPLLSRRSGPARAFRCRPTGPKESAPSPRSTGPDSSTPSPPNGFRQFQTSMPASPTPPTRPGSGISPAERVGKRSNWPRSFPTSP